MSPTAAIHTPGWSVHAGLGRYPICARPHPIIRGGCNIGLGIAAVAVRPRSHRPPGSSNWRISTKVGHPNVACLFWTATKYREQRAYWFVRAARTPEEATRAD